MATRRHWQLAGSAALLALVSFAAIRWREAHFKLQLRDRTVAALRDRDAQALLAVAPWQRLGVFGPYTSDDVISREMRIKSRLSASTGLELSDSICLVVLVLNTGEVEDLVVSRTPLDLCSINQGTLPLVLSADELREPRW